MTNTTIFFLFRFQFLAIAFGLVYARPCYAKTIYRQDSVKRVAISLSATEKSALLTESVKPTLKRIETPDKKAYPIQHRKPLISVKNTPIKESADSFVSSSSLKKEETSYRREDDTNTASAVKNPAQPIAPSNRFNIWILILGGLLLASLLYIAYLYKKGTSVKEKELDVGYLPNAESRIKHLENVNILKDKLFAIIGHDLRAPIGNLRAVMELFQTEGMAMEEIAAILKEILPSVENADLIVCNLLNWAVSQMDGLKINKSNFSYHSMVEETISSFTYLLKAKQINVENNVALAAFVCADEDHVRIIVRNLLSNAVKFAPIGGEIKFYNCTEIGSVVLAVEDNGEGILEADLKQLFKNDSHFTKTGTNGEKGTGIGLLLCQEMAHLNHGKISASSKPGKSCTFFLELPKSKTIQ